MLKYASTSAPVLAYHDLGEPFFCLLMLAPLVLVLR